MKIAILTICLGKYAIFFENFYNSINHNFLKNYEKKFFVFSDATLPILPDIIKIEQRKIGWPYDSMHRFKMFNAISDELIKYDFIIFLNLNMLVVSEVGDEILPRDKGLMGVIHPGFYNNSNSKFPYERSEQSEFYIPPGQGKFYYQGCLNGGKANNFLEMSRILQNKIESDEQNGIIPIWHDETALNWYYHDKEVLSIHPGYAYPETYSLPFDKKIIQIDKNKFGGHLFLRS